jgi:hypothetical protein
MGKALTDLFSSFCFPGVGLEYCLKFSSGFAAHLPHPYHEGKPINFCLEK